MSLVLDNMMLLFLALLLWIALVSMAQFLCALPKAEIKLAPMCWRSCNSFFLIFVTTLRIPYVLSDQHYSMISWNRCTYLKCQTSLDFKSWFKFIVSRYHCIIYGINIHEFRSRLPAGQSTSLQVLDSARGIILDDTHLVPLLTASAILPLKCE